MRKGQAAMEFLMTYGWAILVVLAAIGTLAYFGVLSPTRFLPEKCTMSPGIDCAGFKIEPAQTTLVLRNGLGRDLTITSITVGSCTNAVANGTFLNGDQATYTLTGCTNGVSGERFKEDVEIAYTESLTGLTKKTLGDIVARIQ